MTHAPPTSLLPNPLPLAPPSYLRSLLHFTPPTKARAPPTTSCNAPKDHAPPTWFLHFPLPLTPHSLHYPVSQEARVPPTTP